MTMYQVALRDETIEVEADFPTWDAEANLFYLKNRAAKNSAYGVSGPIVMVVPLSQLVYCKKK